MRDKHLTMQTTRAVVWTVLCMAVLAGPFGFAQATVESQAAPSVPQVQPAINPAQVPVNAPPAPQPPVVQAPMPAPTGMDTQTVHILTGRSVIINLQTRLRRVLVSNPGIIGSITTSPSQLVLTAKQPGTSSVILWDETGHSRILDVYSDINVAGLRDSLQQAFPSENIQVESDQGRVVLTGIAKSKAAAEAVIKVASSYSKDVVNSLVVNEPHPRQIMLKVTIAEVDRTKLSQFGINFLSTGALNTPGAISTQQFGPFSLGGGGGSGASVTGHIPGQLEGATSSFNVNDLLNIFLFRPDLNLGVTIRALQQRNVLQILAEPNLLAENGQTASFLAGGEFPFPVVQSSQVGNAAITIQFRPFGVKLDFTGTITDDDVIRLKVAPEVSALDFSNALTISGFVIPALSTRRAETQIELKNGQSFGIAGLLDSRTTALMNKIPGIGDIPVLGQLFRSKSTNRSASELLVVVTPTIIDPVHQAMTNPNLPQPSVPNLDEKKFDQGGGSHPAKAEEQPQPANAPH